MTAKDVDVKAVSWGNIEVGDCPLNKAEHSGQMVKSVLTICGIDAMALNTEQLRQICGQGYRIKPKAEVLRIMAVAKLHQNCYEGAQEPSSKSRTSHQQKPKIVLFSCYMFYSQMKCPLN